MNDLLRNRNIVFLRHGKVDLPYPSHDLMPFEVLNSLANRSIDPASNKDYFDTQVTFFKKFLKQNTFTHIFYSSSNRCRTLAAYIHDLPCAYNIPMNMVPEFQEIEFDLSKLSGDQNINLPLIRSKIIERLVKNESGVEPLSSVLLRIHKAVESLPLSGNILVLTHGYLMMVIAAMMQHDNNISPETLNATPRFQYFEGFRVDNEKKLHYLSIKDAAEVVPVTSI